MIRWQFPQKQSEILKKSLVILVFAGIGVMSRLVDHIPNFTPITGIALFLSYLWNRYSSMVFVLLTMLISDYFIGIGEYQVQLSVYAGLLLPSYLGVFLKKFTSWKKYAGLAGFSLASSVFFYLITNFAVWLWSGMYEPDLNGLLLSYYYAIPFFKNTVAGDLFSSFFVFGVYDVIAYYTARRSLPVSSTKEKA